MRWNWQKPCDGFVRMTSFLQAFYYWGMTALAAVVSFVFYPCVVIGRENIPAKGGFILASNHESNIDPILLPVACPRQMRFMAKEELFRNPLLAFLIRTGGGFPVRRGKVDRSALKEFLRQLQQGYPVLIFPQGTRGGVKVQPGAGFLALTSSMPVVPAYIEGTDKVLAKGAVLPRRTLVRVVFGEPFVLSKELSSQEASRQIMASISLLKPTV